MKALERFHGGHDPVDLAAEAEERDTLTSRVLPQLDHQWLAFHPRGDGLPPIGVKKVSLSAHSYSASNVCVYSP